LLPLPWLLAAKKKNRLPHLHRLPSLLPHRLPLNPLPLLPRLLTLPLVPLPLLPALPLLLLALLRPLAPWLPRPLPLLRAPSNRI